MMQKSALSGSTSSNLIAGISPHVRRFSVWAFLKTVTTALHSDFLFTTQEKRPLLTCIALKSLNLCTQTYMGLLHHTRITARRTRHARHKSIWTPTTDRLDLIYPSPLHRHNIAPYYATPQTEVWRAWRSVTLPWNRDFYTRIIRLTLALPFCNRNYNIAMLGVGNIPDCAFICIFIYGIHSLAKHNYVF